MVCGGVFVDFMFARLLARLRPPPRHALHVSPGPLFMGRPQPPPPPAAAPAALFHLRTVHGRYLVAGAEQVELADVPDPVRAMVAVLPSANPQLALLMTPDLRPVGIRADGLRSPALSAFRMQTETARVMRLRHPLAPRRFLGVTVEALGTSRGEVVFDSLGQTHFELFEQCALDPAGLPPSLHVAIAELCAAAARPLHAAALLDALHGLAVRPEFAACLLRVLPQDELARLARWLLEQPHDLAVLAAAMPDDPWMTAALRHLAHWHAARAPVPGGVLISPAEDECAADPMEGYCQPQAGFAINALARGQVLPGGGACLLASARNEGPYLLEWLAYHRSIGFAHAFIYTNENSDRSDTLLEALARNGVITLIHNAPGTHCGPQYKAYAHALTALPQILDYDWAAILDLDEYFAFDTEMFRSVDEFLAWQETQPVDAIALCWQMFVAGRSDLPHDEPTLTRFVRREPNVNQHVKSLFRPRKFWGSHLHFPYPTLDAPFVYRTETGALHHHPGVTDRIPAFAPLPTAARAWVNHYWLRTAPETLWKLARGHGDWKAPTPERHLDMAVRVCRGFVTLADRADLVEDRRILACAAGMDDELARLRALAGVADAETDVREVFARRLPRMAAAFIAEVHAEEPPEFAPFRDVLRGLAGAGLTTASAPIR